MKHKTANESENNSIKNGMKERMRTAINLFYVNWCNIIWKM